MSAAGQQGGDPVGELAERVADRRDLAGNPRHRRRRPERDRLRRRR